jgi:hypothetical protein
MSKMMYIGAGLHLEPLSNINFRNVKEFIFVDTLPRSQFDNFVHKNKFEEIYYGKYFIDKLIENCEERNFELVVTEELDKNYFTKILSFTQRIKWLKRVKQTFPYICPTLIIFYNKITHQYLKYYVSTNILFNMNNYLKNDLKTSNGLIISGYHPDIKLLQYIKKPINLYCYSETAYNIPQDEIDNANNIVALLFQNEYVFNNYFNNIYVCHDSKLISCTDLMEMDKIVLSIREKAISEAISETDTTDTTDSF